MTQKYDIHALRALQDLEAKLNEDLVKLYNVEDEDGLPEDATVDIISVYNLDADKKLEELVISLNSFGFLYNILIIFVSFFFSLEKFFYYSSA